MTEQPITRGTNGTPDEVVLGYVADMKQTELWAKRWASRKPEGEWDWTPVRTRLDAVRERYCTPRVLARPVVVGFGDPPQNDPDWPIVTEVRMTRRDRAVVVTKEREAFDDDWDYIPRYEYRLHLIGGEWRLNSRVLDDQDGGSRIRGPL
jgi:hypothetical protein